MPSVVQTGRAPLHVEGRGNVQTTKGKISDQRVWGTRRWGEAPLTHTRSPSLSLSLLSLRYSGGVQAYGARLRSARAGGDTNLVGDSKWGDTADGDTAWDKIRGRIGSTPAGEFPRDRHRHIAQGSNTTTKMNHTEAMEKENPECTTWT